MTLVGRTADREREQAEQKMRAEIGDVARRMVLVPVEQELSDYGRFRDELAVARGEGSRRHRRRPAGKLSRCVRFTVML